MKQKVLFSHPNSLRLYGPAGSGKTQQVVNIMREHVEDGDFPIQEAIVCSFTRIAARDIARRVKEGDPARYHCTLHALVKRYYGIDTELADLRLKEFFEGEGIDYQQSRPGDAEEWASSIDDSQTEGSQLVAFWSKCRNRLISFEQGRREYATPPALSSWWVGDRMDRLWSRYCSWKQENGLIDFTDMLEIALESPPTNAYWPAFVMDEAQDATPLQWAVANVFAARSEVAYLAGDDDQAIYSWAGATPLEFLNADVTAEDTLRVNHRCSSTILDSAQEFIRRNKVRHDKDMVAANDGGIVERVTEMPGLDLSQTTFVMGRAHYLLDGAMAELEAQGVPFVDKRGSRGVNGKAAVAYGRFTDLAHGRRLSLAEWRRLADVIPSRGPWLVRGAKTRLKNLAPEMQEMAVGLDGLMDYGATESLVNAIRSGVISPLKLPADRLGYLRRVADLHGTEYLEPQRAAQVCTVGPIHAFKGLECDHAIVHSGMPPAATREAQFAPEPERRVMYVAMTRARSRLTHLTGGAYSQWAEVL